MAFQPAEVCVRDVGRPAGVGGLAPGAPPRAGDILAPGFAMSVGAWIVAYLSFVPLVTRHPSGQVIVSLMLAVVFVGGLLAARYSEKGALAALLAGLVSGILDILIVGAVFYDLAKPGELGRVALLWIAGSVLLNTVVAGLGGLVGRFLPARRRGRIRWASVFALVLAAATLPLITAGGLVTAYGVGMSVPDWPLSFGNDMFLYPLSQMQARPGTFYEHAHRLLGTLVGLTSLAVAIYVNVVHRRTRLVPVAWAIFAAVFVQGLLGGFRVTQDSIPLATIHGIFAQVVFASMACLAVAASQAFAQAPPPQSGSMDRLFSSALVLALILQLALGALVRQRVDSLVLLHITLAGAVTIVAFVCGFRAVIIGTAPGREPLISIGISVLSAIGVQLLLGVIALILRPATAADIKTTPSALWTTAHQANGAALLALCAVLGLWYWRLFSSRPRPAALIGPSASLSA